MGTGVGPSTSFLKDSGFELEKDGGIAVDEYLRVKGHQNIYAIGDIAHYPQYPAKFQRRVEHWNVAGNHGREVAHNIAKPNDQVAYTKIPIFWSSVGKGLRYLGTGAGFDDTYTDGNVDELKVRDGGSRRRAWELTDSSSLTRRRRARSRLWRRCSGTRLSPRLRN